VASKPSYDLKADRAEKHLVDLEEAIAAYAASDPYEIAVRSEGKKKPNVHRLHFTRQPDDEVALIAGDFIQNIRSALDHLACCLVPSDERTSVMFPIFFQGVWEPAIKGENQQRLKDRMRWQTVTCHMPDEAVALLKRFQPPDLGKEVENTHALAVLNGLANKDRHSKLLVIASALHKPSGLCRTPDGALYVVRELGDDEGLRDNTPLVLPTGAVDVKVMGTPVVMIRTRYKDRGFRIPGSFRELLLNGTRRTIDFLRPYDRIAR
jgi:hypothetical protein